MIQRIALLIASITAAAVLGVALVTSGYAPTPAAAPVGATSVSDKVQAVVDPAPTPQASTQVDTVYVKPAPSPKVVRIVKTAPTKPPIVVRRVVSTATGGENSSTAEHDGASEGD